MVTQQHNPQFSLLQEKIKEIGSAIFYNLSDSVLKLPTSIVSTLHVDDYGFVWFSMKKPRQHVKEFEAEFPVRLDYFKKGAGAFLQVSGKGWMVNDPEEMSVLQLDAQEVNSLASQEAVLVKVKILKADVYETHSTGRKKRWASWLTNFTSWFRNNQYRPHSYYPAS
jgi:general stress protein 26